MVQMNMENLFALIKLWENARIRKSVLQKQLLKMKPALTGHETKKPECCTLMQLWENALVQKFASQQPVQ
jgi:hypothetical protein